MKKILAAFAVFFVLSVAALAVSFSAQTLPVGEPLAFEIPKASPPVGTRLSVLPTGKMFNKAGFAYRGGDMSEVREFGMAGILLQHPRGALLFDAGFGRRVDEHFKTTPTLMQWTSKYEKGISVADQLTAAGLDPSRLPGIVLTHAHWDHVSGIEDLPGVPVWVNPAELAFVRSGSPMSALARSFGTQNYAVYEFNNGPYLGFEKSYDIYGDGSAVLVPAPGHTPGSIIAFINLPDGKRYALVGDLVWQREGVEIPAERPWLLRRLVDVDAAKVRDDIAHLNQIMKLMPDLVVVPAHDQRVLETLPRLPSK